MKWPARAAWAFVLWTSVAHAQPKLFDRTTPMQDRSTLERGTPEERTRVLARTTSTTSDDESLALTIFAAEHATALALDEHELVMLARGLAARSTVEAAQKALLLLLVPSTPTGETLHQTIAATALAQTASAVPARAKPKHTNKNEHDDEFDVATELLTSALDPRFEALITAALMRHPLRRPPPELTGPAFLRIGAKLGDLRWDAAVEHALQTTTARTSATKIAALEAVTELGDARALPHVRTLATDRDPELRTAAFRAWLALEPAAASRALGVQLARIDVTLSLLALARFSADPKMWHVAAEDLAKVDSGLRPHAIVILAELPGAASTRALAHFATEPETMHLAFDALARRRGSDATDALATLLASARVVDRYEAAFALFDRALAPGRDGSDAHRVLTSAASRHVALPAAVRTWIDGGTSARSAEMRRTLDEILVTPVRRPLAKLAECARAVRLEAPWCAFAFARALPPRPDDAMQEDLHSLFDVTDPSVRSELFAGLAQSAWPGRTHALATALEAATERSLRRRLAAIAAETLATTHDPALEAARTRLLVAEPDGIVAARLQGAAHALSTRPFLLRADEGAQVRCGYARDELGEVRPFVLEQGSAIVDASAGETLEVTFTACADKLPP